MVEVKNWYYLVRETFNYFVTKKKIFKIVSYSDL